MTIDPQTQKKYGPHKAGADGSPRRWKLFGNNYPEDVRIRRNRIAVIGCISVIPITVIVLLVYLMWALAPGH